MDWMTILTVAYNVCLLPLIGILSFYLISWLSAKKQQALMAIENDTADRYVAQIFDTVSDCVSATTQTYVSSLKAQGKFDEAAQKKAFEDTYLAVLNLLTDEAKEYITMVHGDIKAYLTTKIEAEVKAQK